MDSLQLVVEYVQSLRDRHNIVPGPSAKGLASDEYGVLGQYVFDDLVRSTNETGSWKRLQDPKFLEEVATFVKRAAEWDAQHPPPDIPLAGLTKRVGNFVPVHGRLNDK
jgi:hypothetical protein